jgi:hypothetical protein
MTNKLTGRLAMHHRCCECEECFPAKNVKVDHKHPVVRLTGFVSWDDVINRLFVEKDLLQVMCATCHHWKTQAERQLAREALKDDDLMQHMHDIGDEGILKLIEERARLLAKENE